MEAVDHGPVEQAAHRRGGILQGYAVGGNVEQRSFGGSQADSARVGRTTGGHRPLRVSASGTGVEAHPSRDLQPYFATAPPSRR